MSALITWAILDKAALVDCVISLILVARLEINIARLYGGVPSVVSDRVGFAWDKKLATHAAYSCSVN